MEWVETTGRTIEEAQEAALDELGVDEQDAEFEVVAEARVGLFGRLRSEARVRARVRPTAPRAKEDRRDRRRRRKPDGDDTPSDTTGFDATGSDAGASESGTTDAAGSEGTDSPAARPPNREPAAPRGGRAAKAAPRPRKAAAASAPADPVVRTERSAGATADDRMSGASAASGAPATDATSTASNGRPGARRGGPSSPRSRTTSRRPAGKPAADGEASQTNPEEAGQVEVALEDQGQVALEFLRGLIGELGLGADIQATKTDDDTLEVDLAGDDLGILIGQKGTTLFALQDLTRTVVQRKTGASNGRLLVDVGGYRHKRHEALARFAEQVAEQVRASGTRKAMEPMNAADRKVVHDTITDIEGVVTMSEGEDPRRYVVVLPAE